MKSKKYLAGAAIALGALAFSNAQATIIDISGAAEGGFYTYTGQSSNGPTSYTALGFEFSSVGTEAHFHDDYLGFGTVLMHDNQGDGDAWVLTRVGGGTFNAVSFTAIVQDGMRWFTNLNPGGTNVANGLNTINANGISSLSFVLSNPSSCCGDGMTAFDVNTNVTAVPEPETYAMMLAGLGLLGFAARRKKAQEAAAA